MIIQDPPYAVQIEATLGCNLNCTFCGIGGIGYGSKAHGYSFMEVATAERIAAQIAKYKWNPRIEIAVRGEPTMNPNLPQIIAAFRNALPKVSILVTSNGGGILRYTVDNLNVLFEKGLNTFAFDAYEVVNIDQKIRKAFATSNVKPEFTVHEYPEDKTANPHQRQKPSVKRFVFLKDISVATKGTHSTLNNHAGYGGKADFDYAKPCAKVFREMTVFHNGDIPKCCTAWGGEDVCGNILEEELDDIWNGPRFHALRQKLLLGERDFSTCAGCDHPSYRTGLLPDKYGKQRAAYPKPDSVTDATLSEMADEGFKQQPTKQFHQNRSK